MLTEWEDRTPSPRGGRKTSLLLGAIAIAVLIFLAAALSGCSSKSEKAHERMEFLRKNGATYGEICDASKAYVTTLADEQSPLYKGERSNRDTDCAMAETFGRGSSEATRSDTATNTVEGLIEQMEREATGADNTAAIAQ